MPCHTPHQQSWRAVRRQLRLRDTRREVMSGFTGAKARPGWSAARRAGPGPATGVGCEPTAGQAAGSSVHRPAGSAGLHRRADRRHGGWRAANGAGVGLRERPRPGQPEKLTTATAAAFRQRLAAGPHQRGRSARQPSPAPNLRQCGLAVRSSRTMAIGRPSRRGGDRPGRGPRLVREPGDGRAVGRTGARRAAPR